MGFKKMETNLSFTDISLFTSMEHNRAITRMEQITAIVDWSRIENLLLRSYPVGKSNEGNEAYPPLILMKCLLLQQWFHIDSDPELETQINDRISFKKFLGLSFDQHSPDHSTFSRFRSRLSHDTMRLINHELLSQFAAKGLTIKEGIAVDARLVQAASHPMSKEKHRPPSMTASISLFASPAVCHTKDPIKKVYADKGYFFMLFGPGSRG